LIISNNEAKEYSCGSLGKTMEVVFREKDFYEMLKNKFSINIPAKNIHLKYYQKTDIIKINLRAGSVDGAQKNIDKVFQSMIKMAPEYYPSVANISIKTLEKPQVVDNFNLSLQRGGIAFLIGLIIGLFVIELTNFRLQLLPSTEKRARGIVSQKLKQELDKVSKQKILEPEIEEYVFQNGRVEKITLNNWRTKQNNLSEYKKTKKKKTEKIIKQKEKPTLFPDKFSDNSIEVHEISLNAFKTDLQKEKPNKPVVPDNLPIFIDDDYNKELAILAQQEKTNSNIDNKAVAENVEEEIIKETIERDSNTGKSFENKQKIKEDNIVTVLEEIKIKKKSSAHNIANGFAPDQPSNMPDNKELTTEEIKERLNKLLRGDL